jgi:hypothetical protein
VKIKYVNVNFLLLILFLVVGCKHAEKVIIEKKVKPVSARRVVKMVNENEFIFNTLSVKRLNLTIDNGNKVYSLRGFYKIKSDSVIQISAQRLTIPVGKLEIGKDSFLVVNHIGKQVYSGSIQKIGALIGYDFDYQTIQSILSNQMQSLKQDQKENQFKEYVSVVEDNMYKISSIRDRRFKKFADNDERFERFKQRKDEQHLVKQDIYVDPDIFVVRKEVFHDLDSDRIVTIEYSDFMAIGKKWFPGRLHIFLSGKEKFDLVVELSKVTINDESDFSFTVPVRYKKEELKKNTILN